MATSSATAALVDFSEPPGETGLVASQATNWITSACGMNTTETISCFGMYSSALIGTYIGIAYLLEPDGSNVSDTVKMTWVGDQANGIAAVVLNFTSDSNNDLGALPTGFRGLVENGQLQDLTPAFNLLVASNIIDLPSDILIRTISDVSDTVPEPGTLALLGLGLMICFNSRNAYSRADLLEESGMRFPTVALSNRAQDSIGDWPLRARFTARFFDVVTASALLVLTGPVTALTVLAIWVEGGGRVLYRQTRIGLRGAPFQMLKLRSMRSDAEGDGAPQWTTEDDPRITRVGRIIRKTRIDEIPQLLNVLKGEMSLIGPRPERPQFVETLSELIPLYTLRHTVKPGITGWAQVRYHYAASNAQAARKLDYDLYYVTHHNFLLDLRILFETVGVVLTARGAR